MQKNGLDFERGVKNGFKLSEVDLRIKGQLVDEFNLRNNKVGKLELARILNSNINCLNLTESETDQLWKAVCPEEKKTISFMDFASRIDSDCVYRVYVLWVRCTFLLRSNE